MRFKATIGTPLQLSKLVATLERMGDTCTVHLTPELMQFAVVPDKDAVHLSADVNHSWAQKIEVRSAISQPVEQTPEMREIFRQQLPAILSTLTQKRVQLLQKLTG